MYFDDIWGVEKNCMVLTGKRDEVITDKVLQSSSDPNELNVLTSWLIEFNSTLSLWRLSKLTQSFERNLTQYRDKFSDVNIHDANKALSELQILSQEYSSFQQNLIPLAIELSSFCEVYYDKLRKTVNFKRLREEFMESTFFDLQKEWLHTLSKHLIKYERESQRAFDRTNQLITTVVNNKLSKTNQKYNGACFL